MQTTLGMISLENRDTEWLHERYIDSRTSLSPNKMENINRHLDSMITLEKKECMNLQ